MITVILFILLITIYTAYYIKKQQKPKGFPPGPKWVPFLGCRNIVQHYIAKYGSQWRALSEIAKEHKTEVLGLKLGNEEIVVVFGDKNIRQVFMEREFEGRPDNFFIRLRCLGRKNGITFTDGPLWRELRQFTTKHLRSVGFGKSVMEKEIQKELMNTIAKIEAENHSINTKSILASSVMNILWRYAAGEQIEAERLDHLIKLFDERSKAFSMAGGWLNEFPWCRFLFPELSGYALINRINLQLIDIIDEAIMKHENDESKYIETDFITAFLKEITSNSEIYTTEQLRMVCMDILIAGSQTSSNVIEFAFLTVLRDQEMQEKIYNEIKTVVGDEVPRWNHNYRLVYTSAFLLEVHRYYSIVPLAGPRRVLSDTTVDGYHIPKETTVLIALADLHRSKDLWENPDVFMPERFINDKGELVSPENLYPFGLGKRRCPGDTLAKSFIFITFVGLIQKFRVTSTNETLPSNEPIFGLLSSPKPFLANFLPRR